MGDHHIRVFLLVLAAVVSVKATDLCPFDGNWIYHDSTGTCISLQNVKKDLADANGICRSLYGGIERKSQGYMVRIYDKNTDNIVKELLKANSVEKAWIGVMYDTTRSLYRWTNSNQALTNYIGWIPGQTLGNTLDVYVAITEIGWEIQNKGSLAAAVCQVDAVVNFPTISCSPAKIGLRSPNIDCSLDAPTDLVTLFELSFEKASKVKAACTGQGCPLHQRYEASITAADNSSWSSVLNIRDVQRQDEGGWSCSVKFGGGNKVTSNICNLNVYAVPSTIDCEVNYLKDAMTVTCTTPRMYPEASCHWNVTSDLTFQEWPADETTGSISEYQGESIYYRTVCNATVTRPVAGDYYLFSLSVYPIVVGLDLTQSITVKSVSMNVTVETPKDPVLYNSSGVKLTSQLEVTIDQFVTINCQIEGGRPEVYSIFIKCYGKHQSTSLATTATIEITITSDFHGRNCSCYGKHVSGFTRNTTVTFLVLSPPKVTSFSISNIHDHAAAGYNENIFLKCQTTGYPQYRISLLYYQDGDRILTTTVSSSEMNYNMTTTCQSMGRYTCLAENNDRQMDVKHVRLSVKCGPSHCRLIEPYPRYAAAVDSIATIKMCIRDVYPTPKSLRLYKVVGKDENEFDKSRSQITFTYTDELRGLGEATLTIFSVSKNDFGVYNLYLIIRKDYSNDNWWSLKFELLARGPPSCPKYMKVSSTFSDSITLSWIPGYDGGLQQAFTIFRYDSCLTTEPQNVSEVLEPEGNLGAAMSYNVTGLSQGSSYAFSLTTENEEGVTNCTQQVKVSLKASTPIGFDTTLPTLAQTTPAQTTQSDSTVRYTTERVTSYDSTTAATQPSTVSYGTSESTRLPIRNDFECHLTYMDVFLPEELAPNSVLKLRNSSCQLSYNGSHYVTSFSYNECGTTQEYYYTNLILVKNEITVHVKLDKSDSIQFAADYTIPLTCVVRVNSTAVSGSFQVVDRDPFSPQYGHSPDLVLREYANGRYEDEITQYPVKVPINREIFFELAVTQSREDGNGIKIDKCEATPTPDANDTVRYLLISDGCPASPAVRIIPSPGKYRIRFIVQTFHFNVPANQSNLVYVHCYASGCQQFGCYRPCLGFKRRRRSSNHRVSTSIASSGSHIIVPE